MAAILFAGIHVTSPDSIAAEPASDDTSRPRHHGSRGFRNNYPHDRHGGKDFLKFLGEFRRGVIRKVTFPVVRADLAFLQKNHTQPTLTWIGHDSFLLQINGLNILTDPHFSERASPVGWAGPARSVPPAIALKDLPPIDIVLISHNHYDHLDEDSVIEIHRRQPDKPPRFYVPLKVKAWFRARGIDNVVELDWWGSDSFGDFKFHAVPVQHFSSRGAFDRNKTLWCGWVGEIKGFRFFFAGDSGYSKDFADIHARLGAMDLSLIPIGAYEPRWFMRAMHVNPEEAVRIHQDVHSRFSVAMHWGTFRLTLEDMDEPPKKLAEAMKIAGVAEKDFVVMQHGETRNLDFLMKR